MSTSLTGVKFTPEEEKRIQDSVDEYQRKQREEQINAEIQNRIYKAQRDKMK